MSHQIIIIKRAAASEPASAVEAEVKYTPDHNLSPAEVGAEVAKIMRKLNKLGDTADTGE